MQKVKSVSATIVRNIIFLLLPLVLIFKSTDVFAHADHDKARYVATDGIDTGKCDNPLFPCKSFSYAGLQSNKGDRIRVAAGNYVVDDVDTLFYLLSDLVPTEGGYDRKLAFEKSNSKNITRLLGVPLEFADKLAEKGFTVIVDVKDIDFEKTKVIREKIQVYERLKTAKPATDCDNGFAGDHALSLIHI